MAVALHSFADADIELHGGRRTPKAEAALREALRIRRAALGPDNVETRATEGRLALVTGAGEAKWKKGDEADRALDEADRALEEAARVLEELEASVPD